MINRRHFFQVAGGLLLPLPAVAQRRRDIVFENGRANADSRTFEWTNGGGAPLRLTPEQAFGLPRVAAVVPRAVSRELIRAVRLVKNGQLTPHNVVLRDLAENDRFDFMLSAEGRVEHTVLARPSLWRPSISRKVITVYVTDPETNRQWIAHFFYACNNIAVTRVDAPVQCECKPEDVCWS